MQTKKQFDKECEKADPDSLLGKIYLIKKLADEIALHNSKYKLQEREREEHFDKENEQDEE